MGSSTTVVLRQRCADDAALSSCVLGASSACIGIPSGGDNGGSAPSHERIIGAKATAAARGDKDSSSAPPPPSSSSSSSCAMTVLTAVERSLLRTLAFIFYQLDRNQAKYCASSILQWYFQLQTQLPLAAVDSLERVAESVIALADAKFTKFWLSLLEKELDDDTSDTANGAVNESRIDIGRFEDDRYKKATKRQADDERHQREKTLVKRLYQHVYLRVQSLFSTAGNAASSHTQTPCTSPIDRCDESHFQPHRKRRRYPTYAHCDDSEDTAESSWSPDSSNHRHDSCRDDEESEEEDVFEPGWAVEYMEQESMVPNDVTRRMHQMMHSTIPLNLFRVTVTYNSEQADDAGDGGFVGVISPESFPPTPITRDLQTQRMNCYTVSVLDHATLALRLLEANYGS